MVRKRTGQDDEVPLYFGLTPNQVVAYNLAQARALKGWTQDQAAEALEPHLGARWSSASYSAAERSVDGNRIRNFEADGIVAFDRAYELPINWLFHPPPPWAPHAVQHNTRTREHEPARTPPHITTTPAFG